MAHEDSMKPHEAKNRGIKIKSPGNSREMLKKCAIGNADVPLLLANTYIK